MRCCRGGVGSKQPWVSVGVGSSEANRGKHVFHCPSRTHFSITRSAVCVVYGN